jgi:hypothetical protein
MDLRDWTIAGAIMVVLLPLAAWAGIAFGTRTARRNPSAAMALWMLMSIFKVDPPPPPKLERVSKDEEGAGDPPKV